MPKYVRVMDGTKSNAGNFEYKIGEINIAKKYLRNSMFLKEFNTAILYESYIYKNTNPQNIRREILEDEISILYLNGMNGRIRKNEYINLVKKS